MQYLRAVISKAKAMQQLVASTRDRDIFAQTVNLSDFFRADTFLNALRQQTARETKQPMDTLMLNTSWTGDVKHGKQVAIRMTGLQLEGGAFDGGRLSECSADASGVTPLPTCSIAWIPRVTKESRQQHSSIVCSSHFRMWHNKKHAR
jgi:dynein heavy chain 2, cytosolic